MLSFLPAPLLGVVSLILFLTGTFALTVPFFGLGALYCLCPFREGRRRLSLAIVAIADFWNILNSFFWRLTQPTRVVAEFPPDLSKKRSYLLVCNHRSWVDVVVLWHLLGRHIPFLRFFLKAELIWLPILGPGGALLGYPFMKRYTRDQIARHPHLKGKDLERTRRACARFRREPVGLVNFVEGTRFSESKHDAQGSPYVNLLKPRAGGLSFAIAALEGVSWELLDCTIYYPHGKTSIVDLFCGRIAEVLVHIEKIDVPQGFEQGDYLGDAAFRDRFQDWVGEIWKRKDGRLDDWRRAASTGIIFPASATK